MQTLPFKYITRQKTFDNIYAGDLDTMVNGFISELDSQTETYQVTPHPMVVNDGRFYQTVVYTKTVINQ